MVLAQPGSARRRAGRRRSGCRGGPRPGRGCGRARIVCRPAPGAASAPRRPGPDMTGLSGRPGCRGVSSPRTRQAAGRVSFASSRAADTAGVTNAGGQAAAEVKVPGVPPAAQQADGQASAESRVVGVVLARTRPAAGQVSSSSPGPPGTPPAARRLTAGCWRRRVSGVSSPRSRRRRARVVFVELHWALPSSPAIPHCRLGARACKLQP